MMKSVVIEFFEEIANWCVDVGSTKSSNGSYYIYATNIIEVFKVNQEWLNKNADEIADYITAHEDILDVTDVELDNDGNFECFGLWIAGNAICKKCGGQNSKYCPDCEVAHDPEWDNYKEPLTLEDIKLTRDTKKAIKDYNLKNIFIGSLSYVPNNRYVRENKQLFFLSDIDKFEHDLSEKNFVIVFNHFEWSHSCWTVWETPYMDYESIMKIVDKEFKRKLWDSRQLYYDNGTDLIELI